MARKDIMFMLRMIKVIGTLLSVLVICAGCATFMDTENATIDGGTFGGLQYTETINLKTGEVGAESSYELGCQAMEQLGFSQDLIKAVACQEVEKYANAESAVVSTQYLEVSYTYLGGAFKADAISRNAFEERVSKLQKTTSNDRSLEDRQHQASNGYLIARTIAVTRSDTDSAFLISGSYEWQTPCLLQTKNSIGIATRGEDFIDDETLYVIAIQSSDSNDDTKAEKMEYFGINASENVHNIFHVKKDGSIFADIPSLNKASSCSDMKTQWYISGDLNVSYLGIPGGLSVISCYRCNESDEGIEQPFCHVNMQ